jgi:hypothetical protein
MIPMFQQAWPPPPLFPEPLPSTAIYELSVPFDMPNDFMYVVSYFERQT